MTSYDLSRSFWDFSFENPSKIKPIHCSIFFFAIEHCNRLGWKVEFGLPTSMVIEAIGVKSYSVYKKAFDELVDWGFFIVKQYSKNQYSSNIIALKENCKASTKALDKALSKHNQKQHQSTVCIDKQYTETIEPINKEQDIEEIYKSYPTSCPIRKVSNGKCKANKEKIERLLETHSKDELILSISKYVKDCKDGNVYMKNFKTFLNNIPDIDDVENATPTKIRMYSYMIPEIGEKIGTEAEYQADRIKYGKDCQFNMYK